MVCSPVAAADHVVGHKAGLTRFGGKPAAGKLYKIIIKAGQNGNPASFAVPTDPAGGGARVTVERDGGVLGDSLTAGTWTGLGKPPGSKGWRYKNTAAPTGGAVRILLVKETVIRMVAKATGSMPLPATPEGPTVTTIAADGERYCARAEGPYHKLVDGKLIKSKDQAAPVACPSCAVGVDSDGDRLDDCYETDDGVFAAPTAAGSDPLNPDTDGDGIDDGDEVIGTSAFLNLPAMGTNPVRRDILAEYDWFVDVLDCGLHSHEPTPAALAMVTAAFAAAPTANPDGSTGIHFVHDVGQGGPFTGGSAIDDANGVLKEGVNGSEFLDHKRSNFDPRRHGYFHYTILPHRYDTDSTSSGQAELPGDDMIVSLACFGFDSYVANTIVHELGHNLDLRHGGDEHCNHKPNYNSVMNYDYQFSGVDTDCTPPGNGLLDYSHGDRIPLDENDLDENLGTCGAPAWDWNGNTIIETGVVSNINSSEQFQFLCGGPLTVLEDHDDWSNLSFASLSDADGARRGPVEIIDCDNPPPPVPPGEEP